MLVDVGGEERRVVAHRKRFVDSHRAPDDRVVPVSGPPAVVREQRGVESHSGPAIAGGDTAEPRNLHKRLKVILDHLPENAHKILDGGCGRGAYVIALRENGGLAAYGVEHQAEKLVDQHPDAAEGAILRGDLEELGIRGGEFDAVVLNEVLEHVPSDRRALEEVHRVLRPGGTLLVMSPNRLYPFESHGVRLRRSGRALPVSVPFIPYVPLPVGRRIFSYWARNYWPTELRRLIEQTGFRIVLTGFVWQTFEGISGHQPRVVRTMLPVVRSIVEVLERTPLVRRFGVSQLIVAEVDGPPWPEADFTRRVAAQSPTVDMRRADQYTERG